MIRDSQLEASAQQLEQSGEYKVLRRLTPRSVITESDSTPTKLGIFLDLETTGLNSSTDEIIEIAMCSPSAPMAQIWGCDLRRIWVSSK